VDHTAPNRADPRSIASNLNEGFVVGMRDFSINPYDGHTLSDALERVETLTDQRPELAVVDRGHGETKTRVLISGAKRGLTPNSSPICAAAAPSSPKSAI